MTTSPLDELDQHLLTLLQANARTSAASLARQTGAARTTVLARIARLEKSGVIAGYSVKLGGPAQASKIGAHVSISVTPRGGPEVVRAMKRMLEIRRVWAVSGQHDFIAWLECDSTDQLDRALDRIHTLDGVRSTETSVILGVKFDRSQAL